MPRSPHGIVTSIWAETGDVQSPQDLGITFSEGWDRRYSLERGRKVEREGVNWHFRGVSAFMKDANEHGLLEWHVQTPFYLPALTLGRDNNTYEAVRESGPGTGNAAQDPTTDTARTTWRVLGTGLFALQGHTHAQYLAASYVPPQATESQYGTVIRASDSENTAGTDAVKYVTPAGVRRHGDNRYSRGSHTHPAQSFTIPQANETTLGGVTRATEAERIAGVETVKYTTPLGVRQHGDPRYARVSHSHGSGDLPVMPLSKGGTNATNAGSARSNLGLGNAATYTVGTSSGNLAALGSGGAFADDRIPNLNTSKINAGTMDRARLPNSSTSARGVIDFCIIF
jgi:hypothetical protein